MVSNKDIAKGNEKNVNINQTVKVGGKKYKEEELVLIVFLLIVTSLGFWKQQGMFFNAVSFVDRWVWGCGLTRRCVSLLRKEGVRAASEVHIHSATTRGCCVRHPTCG